MCDDDFAIPNSDLRHNLSARNRAAMYIDSLISEVRKRPLLWDKKHGHYGCRTKVNRAWHIIAATLKKRPEEVKAKWRNLKDSFHRLEKRMTIPSNDEETPLASNYTGQWIHFEKLLFLRDTRRGRDNNVDYEEPEVPEICIGDIKGELDISEHSNESMERHTEDTTNEPEKLFTEPIITLQSVLNGANLAQNLDPICTDKKRLLEGNLEGIEAKRRMLDLTSQEEVMDEDLLFVKSLVPFFRRLNPIRKLIVRNEMQSLLLKEMLCENCRSFGPQPNCSKCNLS